MVCDFKTREDQGRQDAHAYFATGPSASCHGRWTTPNGAEAQKMVDDPLLIRRARNEQVFRMDRLSFS